MDDNDLDNLVDWLQEEISWAAHNAPYATSGPWRAGFWQAPDPETPVENAVFSGEAPNAVLVVVAENGGRSHYDARHIASHDPVRVLAQYNATSMIIGECWRAARNRTDVPALRNHAVRTLRLLASVYKDRPGYREEWRP